MGVERGYWTVAAIPGVGIRDVWVSEDPPEPGPSFQLQRELEQQRLDEMAARGWQGQPAPVSRDYPTPGRDFVKAFGGPGR